MKPQSDVIASRLFRACEAPNLRACQAIAAPIVGAWQVCYGYNVDVGYWVVFQPQDGMSVEFMMRFYGWKTNIFYSSHDHGFTRSDLIGCLLAVDAQANKRLPR